MPRRKSKKLASRLDALLESLLSADTLVKISIALGIIILAGTVSAIVSLDYVSIAVPMVGRSRTDQAIAETFVYMVLLAAGFFGFLMIDDALSGPREDNTKLALGLFLVFFSIFFSCFIVFGLKGFRV